MLSWTFQIRGSIFKIQLSSEQQWLWSHHQNICSNTSHSLKRAIHLHDWRHERGLFTGRVKHEPTCLHWSTSYVHDGRMFTFCFMVIVSIWNGESCLFVWVIFITQSFTKEGTSGVLSGEREIMFICARILCQTARPSCLQPLMWVMFGLGSPKTAKNT